MIIIYIVWAQSIATTPYGLTVCGYIVVGELSVILLLIILYNKVINPFYSAQIA
jgi:hypothetical protein